MTTQQSVLRVAIDPTGAVAGAATYGAATNTIKAHSRQIVASTATASKGFNGIKSSVLSMNTAIAGFAVLAGLGAAISEIKKFEEEIQFAQAVTNAFGADFQALQDAARSLGETTRFTAAEAASGIKFLGQAGFDTREILESLPATLDLAVAGAIGLGEAADIASNILTGFGLATDQTTRVIDNLAVTAASTNTNILQMAEAMKLAAPLAANMGVRIEEAAAAVGILGNAGIQGSLAGTALRQTFLATTAETKKASDALALMGLSFGDIDIEARGLIPVLEKLAEKQIDAGLAAQIFQRRAAGPLLTLVKNIDALKEQIKAQDAAAGSAKRMAEIIDNNLGVAFLKLRSAIGEAFLQLGTGDSGLSGALKGMLGLLTGTVRALTASEEQLLEMEDRYRNLAIAVKAFGAALAVLATLKVQRFFLEIVKSQFKYIRATFQAAQAQAVATAAVQARALAEKQAAVVSLASSNAGFASALRLAQANRAVAAAAGAATTRTILLRGAMARLTGVAGIVIQVLLAAAGAFGIYWSANKQAEESTEDFITRMKELADISVASRSGFFQKTIEENETQLAKLDEQIAQNRRQIEAAQAPVPSQFGGKQARGIEGQREGLVLQLQAETERLLKQRSEIQVVIDQFAENLSQALLREKEIEAITVGTGEAVAGIDALTRARELLGEVDTDIESFAKLRAEVEKLQSIQLQVVTDNELERLRGLFDETAKFQRAVAALSNAGAEDRVRLIEAQKQGLDELSATLEELNRKEFSALSAAKATKILEAYRREIDGVAEAQKAARTPQDELNLAQEKYFTLLADGLITQKEFDAVMKQTREGLEESVPLWQQVGDAVENGLASGMRSVIRAGDSFLDVLKNIGFSIVDIITQVVILKPLLTGLFGAGGGNDGLIGAAFSGLRSLLTGGSSAFTPTPVGDLGGGLIGLAHGGRMEVAGFPHGGFGGIVPGVSGGGRDNRIVSFAASGGERIRVTPPGQSSEPTINVNIETMPGTTAEQTGDSRRGSVRDIDFRIIKAVAANIERGGDIVKAQRARAQGPTR